MGLVLNRKYTNWRRREAENRERDRERNREQDSLMDRETENDIYGKKGRKRGKDEV